MMFVYPHGWVMMLGMFLFWLLVLAASVWLVARLFPITRRPGSESERRPEPEGEAMQIVRQRYARGEITKAEYEELVRILV
jgi:putative membrane protein